MTLDTDLADGGLKKPAPPRRVLIAMLGLAFVQWSVIMPEFQ
jgi:hypothetical protein